MAIVTIGSSTYDALADVAFADDFLAADAVRATAWMLRNSDAKGRGLVTATRILLSPALGWCAGIPDIDAPPLLVQQVAAKLAADGLAKASVFTNPSSALPNGVKNAKAGSAQVEFFGPGAALLTVSTPIPADLYNELRAAGLVGCTDASDDVGDGAYVSGIEGPCGCHAPGVEFGWWPGRDC